MRLKPFKGRKSFIRLFEFLCLRWKNNWNVDSTKLAKVLPALYEQN